MAFACHTGCFDLSSGSLTVKDLGAWASTRSLAQLVQATRDRLLVRLQKFSAYRGSMD